MKFLRFNRFLPVSRLGMHSLQFLSSSSGASSSGSVSNLRIPLTTRMLLSIGGQSNGNGTAGFPIIHTDPVDNSHAYSGTLGPLSESLHGQGLGETPASQIGQFLYDIEFGRSIFTSNWAASSAGINSLMSGTSGYTTAMSLISSSVSGTINVLQTASAVVGALLWIHGESDSQNNMTSSLYIASMSLLQQRFDIDARARTLQTQSVPMIYSQMNNFHRVNNFTGSACRAQTDISYASGTTHILACPTYHLAFSGSGATADYHLDATGTVELGNYLAKTLNRAVIVSGTFTPLRPSSITAVGDTITVQVEGGDGSNLSIDTTLVKPKPFYGFYYYDGANPSSSAHINNVSVSGRNITIQLTQTASLTGRLQYAYQGIPQTPAGNKAFQSSGGNIRDNDNIFTSSYGNGPLYNYLIAFDQPITNYTAGDSTYVQQTGSGSIVLDGTKFLTCYDTRNIFSSATLMTIAFQYRAFGGTGGELICINNANERCFAIRRSGTTAIQFSVPSSINSVADNMVTTNVFSSNANITNAVVCVFSGSLTGSNQARAKIYSGSVELTGSTYNGNIPSALVNNAKSALELGSSAGGGSRFSGSFGHIAIWVGQAATSSQLQEIFPGPAGSTAFNQNVHTGTLGAPTFWLKWQGDAYNSGSFGKHFVQYQSGSGVLNTLSVSGNIGLV